MISIKDIARAAHVSHSTVSRALRNSPLVNPKTAARVRRIAEKHHYVASSVARSLVTRRTNTIGVVVTSIADPFAGEVVAGIDEYALANGYSVILAASQGDPEREFRSVQSFYERRVDGVVVMASRVGAEYLSWLSEMKAPIVLVNSHHRGDFEYSVRINNVAGAKLAIGHLLELGHRRIAYMGDEFGFQSDSERLEGYREAIESAGITFDSQLVAYADGTSARGLAAMSQILSLSKRPTAVFCYNDREALGAMRAIREHALKIPDDISVIGFDDLFLSSYTDPPLSTIRQPKHEMGRHATEILFKLLNGEKPESEICDGTLIVRGSTAPTRVNQPLPDGRNSFNHER
jgi:DNA-binding LacI/PurR family transcriptional regulator